MAEPQRFVSVALLPSHTLTMTNIGHPDHIHRASRLISELRGERNIFRATDHLRRLAVQVVLDPNCGQLPAMEAALLTVVNAGSRTMLGGVYVVNPPCSPTLTPLGLGLSLRDAIESLGGIVRSEAMSDLPVIAIGNNADYRTSKRGVRVEVAGWTGAVVPVGAPPVLRFADSLPIAGVLAGALAVSEVFAAVMELHPEACERSIGLSLWEVGAGCDWRKGDNGPPLRALPNRLWIIGLGHLGQAYLWALSSLSFRTPEDVEVWLQDDDRIGPESKSTGLLVQDGDTGQMKTRVAAARLERIGFRTRIIERRVTAACRVSGDDVPPIVLAGVDSPLSRIAITQALTGGGSPPAIIDLGLGVDPTDFDQIAIHSSPFSDADLDRLRGADTRGRERANRIAETFVFGEIAKASSLDTCGIVRLADIAVGVPYVGAAAGAIAIGEVLRRLAGAPAVRINSFNLRQLDLRVSPAFHHSHQQGMGFTHPL